MECALCGTATPGPYCPSCGAPQDGAHCKACDAPLVVGANYCVRCGHAVRQRSSSAGWYVAAATLVALVVVLLVPPSGSPAGTSGGIALTPIAGATAAGAPGRPPPLTGTPREQADRLFNRIMEASAQGDSAQVTFFLPMAVEAYRRVGELDPDGLYHLSVLEFTAGDATGARATAERMLAESPDHLLGLGAAARAALAAGDRDAARRYYEHLLAVYDAQRATSTAEYLDHARILPEYRAEAEAFLGR
ncbi:MAG TPA: zinc ribbon domain-containing protein [Longimicrobiales bacterium]